MNKKYLFYSGEGCTVSPKGEELENFQVLGIGAGLTHEEALSDLLDNNSWIAKSGFDIEDISCCQIVD